ncbi:hypothetical protein FSP39_020019 [Pinctada imbricata]|uniref:BTB domain-containing protein n=1 Tax=Pinctada imbricata TaxID=66713 RepID=A0AA88YEY2_PINIB|nr:hypothetical protein FSP39_020019 [Pinctada imbricata]
MAASIVEDWQSCKSIVQCNTYMWTNQIACDIQFLVGEHEERISAHKYILISRSCVFYSMFCGPLAESKKSIPLPDIEPHIFKELLRFLYTESCDIQPDTVLPLLYSAKKYSIQNLAKKCVDFLDVDRTDNVCTLLEQSYLYDEKELQQKCMTYISSHAKEVMDSEDFLSLSRKCLEIILSSNELHIDEKSVLNCVLRWANGQCEVKDLEKTAENQRTVLGDLLYLVRFPLLGDKYYTEVVADMNILNDEEKVELFKYFYKRNDKRCRFSDTNRFSSATPAAMSMSCHSDMGDTRPIQTCMRYQTVYEDGSWYCGGEPDAISFTCNDKISLHGVLVYGSYIGEGVYDVTCSIYDFTDREVGQKKIRLKTSDSQNTYPILLDHPIDINSGKKHSIVVKLTSSDGLDTYQGKNGLSAVVCNGVRFSFSKSRYSRNGTDVKIGQIPGLLFTSNARAREEYDSA